VSAGCILNKGKEAGGGNDKPSSSSISTNNIIASDDPIIAGAIDDAIFDISNVDNDFDDDTDNEEEKCKKHIHHEAVIDGG
jgi:hypothetical protein